MPDVYNTPILLEFPIIGAATVVTTVKRHVIPFDYQIVGVVATANTPPTGASMILDILAGPNNTAPGSLTTIWPASNGLGIQTVTLTGATGGTFTLTNNSLTTAGIAFNATAAAVDTALATAGITAPSVSGAAGGPYVVTWPTGTAVTALTASASSLTGSTPTAVITHSGVDNRPTIVAASYDQAPIAAGTTTVAPEGTDPDLSGQTTGVSTTYPNYDGFDYLARPDANSTAAQFGSTGPLNTGNPSVVVNSTEGGTLNQPLAPLNSGYLGHAGDALQLAVRQVGSGTAGSDVSVIALIIQR